VVDILREEFPIIRGVYVSGSSEPSLVWLAVRSGDEDGPSSLTPATGFQRVAPFSLDKDPANTMAYDTLPHDWSYQGEVMREKTFGFR
jgi:hypothetical protein